MFFPEGQVRVFLYGQPVSMRLSFDGLYALAKHVMHQDPLSGVILIILIISCCGGSGDRTGNVRTMLISWGECTHKLPARLSRSRPR
jgi:hypothetical protein